MTLDDYTWLANTALQWQIAFSTVLDVPRNIRIPAPPAELWASSAPLSKGEIAARITSQAELLSKIRRAHASQLAYRKPSSQKEQESDWYDAETYFALEIMDRKFSLAKVPVGAYYHLEGVWLRDLIRMKAYFRYLDKSPGPVQSEEAAQEDYFWACAHCRHLLIYGQKVPDIEFLPLGTYVKERYFGDAESGVDEGKVALLIKRKTDQGMAIKHIDCSEAARRFVYMFYNNVIPAIMARDKEAMNAVQDAILLSEGPESSVSIMNCFEAVIAVYFLKELAGLPSEWYHRNHEEG